MEPSKYLIWSIEHNGWWRPNANGYTTQRRDAGVYTETEAFEILYHANWGNPNKPNEALVPHHLETRDTRMPI